mgnify:CR=1 FL=1
MTATKYAAAYQTQGPNVVPIETVDEETGELRKTSAIIPQEHQSYVVIPQSSPVYSASSYALVTDRLFELLAEPPGLPREQLRILMRLLAHANYDNEVKVSLRALVEMKIASSRTRARDALAGLEELEFIRTVRRPANGSRTLMINPALRWRGKRPNHRAAVEVWEDLANSPA